MINLSPTYLLAMKNLRFFPSIRYRCQYTIALLLFGISSMVLADRGEDILPLIQTEALRAHSIALQENVRHGKFQTAYNTRSAYNREASDNAATYIATQFRKSPRLNVDFEDFNGMKNVIATLPPRLQPSSNRIFILCAHYDAKADRDRNWNPLISAAPGADDNAPGVAAMLEIANVLSQFDYEHELRFIAFAGKEIGLVGSRYHARNASQAGENIVAVYNLDMIGFNWENDQVEIVQNDSVRWINDAFLLANRWYTLGLEVRGVRENSVNSGDHTSFWENGYRAVMITESAVPSRNSAGYRANLFYHTSNDTLDRINLNLVRKIAQLVLVTMNSLADMPSEIDTTMPQVIIDPQPFVRENPVQITGKFRTSLPIYIIVHPGNLSAEVNRANSTYTATVPLRIGRNHLRIAAVHPLGARSVEQTIVFEPDFELQSAIVFPNPSRNVDELIVFRAETNLSIEKMEVFIYASDGTLVKRILGVTDSSESRIWRTWWNQKTNIGLSVASGVYVCQFELFVRGRKYTRHRKLAIIR